MKKANVKLSFGDYKNVNIIENVLDLIVAHGIFFGSDFSSETRKIMLGLKNENEITPAIEKQITDKKFVAPHTRISIIAQIKDILKGNFIVMNEVGGYFFFKPENAEIKILKK